MHLILFVTHLLCFIIPHSITSHHERYPSPYIISFLDAIIYKSYPVTLKTTPYFSIFSISQLNKTHCLVVSLSSFLLSNGLKIQFLLFSIEFLLFSPISMLTYHQVQETPDHKETGRWEIYTRSSDIDKAAIDLSQCRKEIFDCVIICSGWFK